jgi:hypothetical protein
MTLIRPTPLSYLNCSHSPVTAPLYPTPGQDAKSMFNQALGTTEIRDYPAETESMFNQALGTTEIRDYPAETDVLAAQTKACATVFTYLQPSASLQSP